MVELCSKRFPACLKQIIRATSWRHLMPSFVKGYHWSKFNLNTVCGRKNIDRFWILQTILWIVQWWHNKGDITYYRAFSRAITGYCFNVTTLAEFEILIDLAFYRLVCKLYRSHMTKEIKSTIVIFCKGLLLLQGSTLWRL